MKKLIIVAVVALAASFGYGASAQWSVDWVYANITGYTKLRNNATTQKKKTGKVVF